MAVSEIQTLFPIHIQWVEVLLKQTPRVHAPRPRPQRDSRKQSQPQLAAVRQPHRLLPPQRQQHRLLQRCLQPKEEEGRGEVQQQQVEEQTAMTIWTTSSVLLSR